MLLDFVNLLFPEACLVCDSTLSKHEKCICVACSDDLPLNPTFEQDENYTTKMLYGRLNLENATSLLLFQKRGKIQRLLHQLKYKGQEQVSVYLGTWCAAKLIKLDWSKDITMVIPVPIHPRRLKTRGYNQVSGFGKAIAEALEVPYRENILTKKRGTKSQVFKRRMARFGELDDTLFIDNAEALQGHHILLVDDIITTGATIESCGVKLLNHPDTKLSALTMAITIS